MARDLRLFYLFRLLATSYLWVPISVLFMQSRGLSFGEIMALGGIYSAVVILVEIPTGVFADRIGRRRSMQLGALAMVAACLVAFHSHSLAGFALSECLAAISMSLCSGADSAYLFDLLQDNGRGHEYPRRESIASAWHQAGNATAFAAGGLIGEIDLGLPYLLTAAVSAAAFVVALCMRGEGRLAERPRQPIDAELREYLRLMNDSVRDVARNRRLAWIVVYSAVVFALLRVTIYLYQPFLDARGFAIWETGMVFAGVYFLAAFVAHRAIGLRKWLGEETLVWGLLATLAASFVLLDQIAGPWALTLLALQAATKGLYSPLVKPILNREISDSGRRATVLSVESIARRLATGVVSILAAFYGAHSAIYACGALGLGGFLVLAATHRHAPRDRGEGVPEAAAGGSTAPLSGPAIVD
jgi:MFS family permease